MARRIADIGGVDSSPAAVDRARAAGISAVSSLVGPAPPRAVWVMVPPPATPVVLNEFAGLFGNAVEYGLMQAYAEGFALLSTRDGLDPLTLLRVWQAGSARSLLLEQTVDALTANPALAGVGAAVADSGMGRWAAEEAIRHSITPVASVATLPIPLNTGSPRALVTGLTASGKQPLVHADGASRISHGDCGDT